MENRQLYYRIEKTGEPNKEYFDAFVSLAIPKKRN